MAKLLHLATPLEKTGNDFGVEIPEEINTDLRDIILTEEMLAKGNRLMDMNLPKGTLVMLIKRGNEFMIPNGSLQLHAGDKLLIISSPSQLKRGAGQKPNNNMILSTETIIAMV